MKSGREDKNQANDATKGEVEWKVIEMHCQQKIIHMVNESEIVLPPVSKRLPFCECVQMIIRMYIVLAVPLSVNAKEESNDSGHTDRVLQYGGHG